jgi:ribosomal protein S12 methylthiotransferase
MKYFEPVGIISLGCPKNIVDSERLLGKLLQDKIHITFNLEEAKSVIINTCAFLQSARDEAESVISEFVYRKKTGEIKRIIVSGCYPSLVKDNLLKKFPEIDALTGTNDLNSIVDAINGGKRAYISRKAEHVVIPRFQITLPHYEYLKIADGCNHSCSFCLIPKIKGKVHSFDIPFLVKEAESLVKNGVKEIILIAQDTTLYGIDIYGKGMLLDLLVELEKIEGLEWIRILYTYPSEITEGLVNYIAADNKVVPYIDVPIQHISDSILKKMNRIGGRAQIEKVIGMLKDKHIAVRTTVITGFPGETDKEFEELKKFIEETRFEHLGAFAFSREKGTASYELPGQLSEEVKTKRKEEIETMQAEINADKFRNIMGRTVSVIVDYYDSGIEKFIGRTEFDAPEIDDYVVINNDNVSKGNIYKAKIVNFDSEKLFAEVLK